jgi:hypothetical protein
MTSPLSLDTMIGSRNRKELFKNNLSIFLPLTRPFPRNFRCAEAGERSQLNKLFLNSS